MISLLIIRLYFFPKHHLQSNYYVDKILPLFESPFPLVWTVFVVQGISHWTVFYELALTDWNESVKSCLKVVLESWDNKFLISILGFQKSNIRWPQQPPKERVPDISKKLDFWWSIPQKGTGFDHLGARDDLTIRISIFFDEMRMLRSLRPLRLLRL